MTCGFGCQAWFGCQAMKNASSPTKKLTSDFDVVLIISTYKTDREK
jgi:hypothetical protein